MNRGNKTVLGSFDRAAPTDVGDGLLLRHGFTVVWVGWEFDVPQRPGAVRIDVPVAAGVTGRVHALQTPPTGGPTLQFGDLVRYAPADPGAASATLTVRDGLLGKPAAFKRSEFTVDGNAVMVEGGFQAGRTYELSYDAANPPIAGLGFAAVRDTVAWLKHAADAPAKAQRALAFGASQSGRYLRTFLYLGFNADEQNRQVFDGVLAHIAGASRLDLNRRWATPTSLGQFDATAFPFADPALRDPVTGAEEGQLANPRAKGFEPKIFYTNTGVEYWGGARSAALIHTTPDGAQDLALPDNERVYFLTGSQHGPARFPPARRATARSGRIRTTTGLRCARCSSRWTTGCARARRRRRAAIRSSRTARSCPRPRWRSRHCPACARRKRCRPARAPRTRSCRTTAGPARRCPISCRKRTRTASSSPASACRTSRRRSPRTRAGTTAIRRSARRISCSRLLGSYIPFPATAAARAAAKDPRAAIMERYASKQAYLDQVRAAGEKLIAARYLLAEDLPGVLERADKHWDLLAGGR